jgi:hypothetical protein
MWSKQGSHDIGAEFYGDCGRCFDHGRFGQRLSELGQHRSSRGCDHGEGSYYRRIRNPGGTVCSRRHV